MTKFRYLLAVGLAALFTTPERADAVEGGFGAYLLGTRDSLMGIVPGPGSYFSIDTVFLQGDVQGVSIGGLPIRARTELTLNLLKLSQTFVFDSHVWGGTPALNISIPIPNTSIEFTGVTPPIVGRAISDESLGVGDIAVTPMVGWHKGKLHYSTGMTVYAPTGQYSKASLTPGSVDLLSNGKNVWSLQPFFAATHLNPENGHEFSGSVSLLASQRNKATDYQTAPALQVEFAALQHLKSGLALGLAGYAYQQVKDDTGTGADGTRTALGASSLQARVFGIGPILTYSGGDFLGKEVSLEVKYYHEFGAKRRFESDSIWARFSFSF